MLSLYLSCLDKWVNIKKFAFHSTFASYVNALNTAFKKCSQDDKGQLLPSRNFNAALTTFPSSFTQRTPPETLEDFFTLIHRNLLVIIETLTKKYVYSLISKPSLINATDSNITSSYGRGINLKATSLSLVSDSLVINYNATLGAHGIAVCVSYKKSSSITNVTIRFIGGRTENDRWDKIQLKAFLHRSYRKLKQSKLTNYEVVLVYNFHDSDDVSWLHDFISAMVSIANGFVSGDDISKMLSDLIDQPNGHNVIIDVARELIKTSPHNNQINQLIRSIIQWYAKNMGREDFDESRRAVKSMFQVAFSVAKQNVESSDVNTKKAGIELLTILVSSPKDLCDETLYFYVNKIITENISSVTDFQLGLPLLTLLTELVKQRYKPAYENGKQVLEDALDSFNSRIKEAAVLLQAELRRLRVVK